MLAPWATPGRAERRQVPSLGSSAIATMSGRDVQHRLAETQSELERLRAENERLRTLLAFAQGVQAVKSARTDDSRQSSHSSSSISAGEKIALIRSLFGGREDVFALRWENARTGKSGYVPATAGGGTKDGPKAYLPLSDDAIVRHLQGRESIGIYPLLEDDTCRFLAFDFDGKTWQLDALAVLESSADHQVQAALERSRSGEGGHVWIFFSAPVAAGSARRLGALLLREAMARRAELDLASYDRLFPNQDFRPEKGFGNLIALPLQARCRTNGTSVFLNPESMEPWADQWEYLTSLRRVAPEELDRLVADHEEVAVGTMAIERHQRLRRDERVPPEVRCTIGSDLAIPRDALPPSLLAALKHLASLHNPLFHERQRLRLSTHTTPRLIRCYEEDLTHLRLPRGLLEQLDAAVAHAGTRLLVEDRRPLPEPLPLEFHGQLTTQQQSAVAALLAHDSGVLVAPPGTGKTVIACALIAERKLPTLILAHSKPLLEQWRSQLQAFLGLPATQIGQRGGGRRKRTGFIDLAMIQSLKAIDGLEDFFAGYGLVVVDECHHLPAFSFETAVRRAPVRHFLGLTATPYRRDGLQEIVTMQCGPVRHEIPTSEGPAREVDLRLEVRETQFAVAGATETPIHEVFRLLVEDEERTALVCDDVIGTLAQGRRCLVLSQWKEHCALLADGLRKRGIAPFVLEGGLGKRARAALLDGIEHTGADDPLVVVATGQYLGEGFDCAQLDTLFLSFPISFKGRLVQYTGRLMRAYEKKTSVRVYDYADARVPVLRAMHTRRLATYKRLGFTRELNSAPPTRQLAVPILTA
jgi:superfamily II DNA or RNA helicase